jgi:hypothetical protein
MKPGPNSKRSRGRGNPRKPNSPRNQTFESAGPEVRVRGSVTQVLEKYLALARDASSAGDTIAAENYFQHAEHYYRILNANGGGFQGGQRVRGPGTPSHRGNGNPAQAGAPSGGGSSGPNGAAPGPARPEGEGAEDISPFNPNQRPGT